MQNVSELLGRKPSRRNFLAGAGAVGAAALVTGCSSGSSAPNPSPTPAPAVTDPDILNFALNLEYLEAEFYLRAVTGSGLATADGAGTVTGGAQVPFQSTVIAQYAAEIASDELRHVRLIRSALPTAAVTAPAITFAAFNAAFGAALITAGYLQAGATFDPFADENSFLLGAFVFEDVGVTAYSGAAQAISSKDILNAAAGIQAVEAYHAAEIRTIIANRGGSLAAAANAISTLRGTLGGGGETTISSGVTANATAGGAPTVAASTITARDGTGLVFGRSTDQVLHIVYGTAGGAGVSSGGFFPSGLNGNIKTTFS